MLNVSCIDLYEADLGKQNKLLVVEGLLTDDVIKSDTIKIHYSIDLGNQVKIEPIVSVKALIAIASSGKKIKLIEYETGKFLPPANFKAIPNEKYSLKFTLPNGEQYESTPELLTPSPPIANIYEKFNPKSRISDNGKKFLSANEVFIDFKDTPQGKNYYLWRYILFEKLQHCVTCYAPAGYNFYEEKCVLSNLPSTGLGTPYEDYNCLTECFAILKGKDSPVFSDRESDGNAILGRIVAKIPYYYSTGCLVEIQQICISKQVYDFYQLLEAGTKSNGGLIDVPPTSIVGNIKNINNAQEKIVGVFGLVQISKKRIWIDRKDASGDFALILGHPIIEVKMPLAVCKEGATRTRIKPEGWQ